MSIETIRTSEIEISWKPTKYTVVGAVVRNGQVFSVSQWEKSMLTDDRIDGYIEFVQAIKQAMEETKPKREGESNGS